MYGTKYTMYKIKQREHMCPCYRYRYDYPCKMYKFYDLTKFYRFSWIFKDCLLIQIQQRISESTILFRILQYGTVPSWLYRNVTDQSWYRYR
jgi:hypothetical protein